MEICRSLTFIVDLAFNIHKALKLEVATRICHTHASLLRSRELVSLKLSISVTDSLELLAGALHNLGVLQVAISRLQRIRGIFTEVVANDTVDGRLGSVSLTVREVVGGQ